MGLTYKMEEFVGTSQESYEDAVKSAVAKAVSIFSEPLWFEVVEMRGLIQGGKVAEFQVKLQIGCKI